MNSESMGKMGLTGRKPRIESPLHVNSPNNSNLKAFLEQVPEIFERNWFSNNGPLVCELESRLCQYLKVKHCVLTCNGTQAMTLLLRVMGLQGEVIVPSFNFISTPHTLVLSGLKPIFADIDPRTHCLDPDHCESLITKDTSAVIATHTWGYAADIERLTRLCRSHKLSLIFDAAHAFGCAFKGNPIGSFGDAEVFSFHATKVFHTFEGGAITTNNDEIAQSLRQGRNFGFNGYDSVAGLGTNAKMTEICAAMGLANLQNFPQSLVKAKSVYLAYKEALREVPGLKIHSNSLERASNHHYMVTLVESKQFGMGRDQLLELLYDKNIFARRYFYPGNHRMEPYISQPCFRDLHFPATETISSKVLLLPAGSTMANDDIKKVCKLLKIASQLRKPYPQGTSHEC